MDTNINYSYVKKFKDSIRAYISFKTIDFWYNIWNYSRNDTTDDWTWKNIKYGSTAIHILFYSIRYNYYVYDCCNEYEENLY
ncbi:hypothetical protein SDC9_165375 [bioreactor metagenome]|uniref:Uncharacterized protein n=1 Tax=bioreactor metagenome TaxID=1076179 RepID=A0A645FU52_9ZZZZ